MQFADGWSVGLQTLYCQATYAGYLEYVITARTNDALIRRMIKKAGDLFGPTPVHVVEPERITGGIVDGYSDAGRPVRRERLPSVCCIGHFQGDVVPGADGCASALVIIWFSSGPPPVPIEPEIVDLLAHVPWDELAANFWH